MSKAGMEVAEAGIATLLASGRLGALGDGELLQFCESDINADKAAMAFDVMVARHGAMVLRVCRSILGRGPSADDAFQATFLILWKKAPSLWVRDSVGPWLHGVAVRIARKARVAAARRARYESKAIDTREPSNIADTSDQTAVIHEELGRLPDKYRMPVVLCHLQGLTHEDAARTLEWPIGTVRGRLARARALLKERLIRRGLAPAVATLGIGLATSSRAETVPSVLANRTWKVLVSEGATAAAGVVPETVSALVTQELHAMLAAKFKVGGAILLAGVLAVGVGAMGQSPAKSKPKPEGKAEQKQLTKGADPLIPKNQPPQNNARPSVAKVGVVDAEEVEEIVKRVVVAKSYNQHLNILRKQRTALLKLIEESNYGVPTDLKGIDTDDAKVSQEVFEGAQKQLSEVEEEIAAITTQRILAKIQEKKLAALLEGELSKEELDAILESQTPVDHETTKAGLDIEAESIALPTRDQVPISDRPTPTASTRRRIPQPISDSLPVDQIDEPRVPMTGPPRSEPNLEPLTNQPPRSRRVDTLAPANDRTPTYQPGPVETSDRARLDALERKLDRILKGLEAKTPPPIPESSSN